jgi:hypothetical protein
MEKWDTAKTLLNITFDFISLLTCYASSGQEEKLCKTLRSLWTQTTEREWKFKRPGEKTGNWKYIQFPV